MVKNLSPAQILAAARFLVCERIPYFASGILHMVFREMPGLGNVGTLGFAASKHWVVLWDPASVAKHGVEGTAALLVHELGHLLQDHHGRFAQIPLVDHLLANVAGDLAINPSLRVMKLKPPEGLLYSQPLKLPEGKTAEEYYVLLKKKQKEHGFADGFTSPECGSCSGGKAVPGEPKDADAENRSEAENRRVTLGIAREIQNQKGRGNIPAGFLRWAEEVLAPPKVNWREELRRVLRGMMAYRPGSNFASYARPSRRQSGIGFGEGRAVLPSFRTTDIRVTVLADTSGSMSKEELAAGMSEVEGIVRVAGHAIDFIVCDAAVHGYKAVRNVHEACSLLRGGGGSDFRPAFEELKTHRPKTHILVAITDGDIAVPETEPAGLPVIWLLTGKRVRPPCLWGKSISLDAV